MIWKHVNKKKSEKKNTFVTINYVLFQENMEKAVQAFFLWRPLLQSDIDELFSSDGDVQEALLKATLLSDIHKKFPVHFESRRLFFKKIVQHLEQQNVEVLEEFYHASVVTASDADIDFHKSYFRNGLYLCSLVETREFVIEGTTGLKTWPGADFLLDHLIPMLQKKPLTTILELGSGIGLTGISILKLNLASKFIFTDHHESVLDKLALNLKQNGITKEKYEVRRLDWEDHQASDTSHDLVIGSDIVFDDRLIGALVSTLKSCIRKGQIAIIANVERNKATRDSFEAELGRSHLDFQLSSFNDMLLYNVRISKTEL